ncbi:hypothetical protein [Rhodococcoides kyotonense]|uniref:Uncharacterized protein n=1 Tax=Rhodococcoides kyotonense TaxID=398843 RepID=A0A239KK10_9NOCA|nr:hypothetical protein [Rhodococcus kyotonensis]SNT18032.1 hypothetical protein SAMN05421642_110204 [Rhodococcus kyotonensis]
MTAKDAANPHTVDTDKEPDGADSDVQSDPAEGTESGDWAGEGGASPEGPATDTK